MSAGRCGNFLERTVTEAEATQFVQSLGIYCTDKGEGAPDVRLRGFRRVAYRSRVIPEHIELELLTSDDDKRQVEVAGLWISRRWLGDASQLPMVIDVYTRFLRDALGEVEAKDHAPLANLLAVSYEQVKTFDALLKAFPFVPTDGVGAAAEVLLGRRMDASAMIRGRAVTLALRNDASGRMYLGVASAKAAFELGDMLFHAAPTFTKGDRAGVLGWKAPDIESTPFGRRFGLELDRAAPPQGRIARRYYGMSRVPRSVKIEVMMEPTRGLAGVLLKCEQEWMERADRNFFAALEIISAFVAEGLGDTPDARARVEIGAFLSVSDDDDDLWKVLKASLPFVTRGKSGPGTAVFLGESESAVAFLDENRCAVVMNENEDGWLDVLFHLTEFATDIGDPAVNAPE